MRDIHASSKARRLARRLGFDGNPLRRRTDRLAAGLVVLLCVVFLIGAPLLSVLAIGRVSHAAATERQAAHSWRQVSAVALKGAPAPASWGLFGYTWIPARWTAPGGQQRTGEIAVSGGVTAGQRVQMWVDAAGTPADPPLSSSVVVARETVAAAVAVAALAIVLLTAAWVGQWVLGRRRLASWEAGWAAVGPVWTKRFRSRG